MLRVNKCRLSLIGIIVILSTSGSLEATAADSDSGEATEHKQSDKAAIRDWFAKYDQIRRNAEMGFGEKLQVRGLIERGIQHADKTSDKQALAHKMVAKYGTAAEAIKDLPSVPETTDLQNGYSQFFSHGQKLFQDCLGSDTAAPATAQALETARKEMEVLDKKNKRLDEELRKKFGIPRHRHI